jgi:hypothetical protein
MLLLLGMQPLHTEQQIKCILGTTSLVACVLHCARQPTLKIISVCSKGMGLLQTPLLGVPKGRNYRQLEFINSVI